MVLAEVGERLAADELQRRDEIVDPVGAAALAASAQTPEQVEVAQHPVEVVRRRDAVLVGLLRRGRYGLPARLCPSHLRMMLMSERAFWADAEVLGDFSAVTPFGWSAR